MNAKINITYRDKDGKIIENPEEGQHAFSPETKKFYLYHENDWRILDGKGGLNFNLYELNKQIIAQLENLESNKEAMLKAEELISNLGKDISNEYYMLLGIDINYYTLFHTTCYFGTEDLKAFKEEVISCLHDIGAIKAIEKSNDNENALEIWVQPIDKEPMVMYLFPYDQGVIECSP